MSAWVDGKIDLKCSLDVLKRALINIHPEWANHLKVDPSGKLSMYRYSGAGSDPEQRRRKDLTVSLIIPGSGHPNTPTPPGRGSHNDWGYHVGKDGKWNFVVADFGKDEGVELANQIRAEILKMRTEALAKLKGMQITSNTRNKDKVVIEMVIDEDKAKEILSLA